MVKTKCKRKIGTSLALFQRNKYWYISLRRGHWLSLKTTDEKKAQRAFAFLYKELLLKRIEDVDSFLETGNMKYKQLGFINRFIILENDNI